MGDMIFKIIVGAGVGLGLLMLLQKFYYRFIDWILRTPKPTEPKSPFEDANNQIRSQAKKVTDAKEAEEFLPKKVDGEQYAHIKQVAQANESYFRGTIHVQTGPPQYSYVERSHASVVNFWGLIIGLAILAIAFIALGVYRYTEFQAIAAGEDYPIAPDAAAGWIYDGWDVAFCTGDGRNILVENISMNRFWPQSHRCVVIDRTLYDVDPALDQFTEKSTGQVYRVYSRFRKELPISQRMP